jgi:hypothetical protein
MEKLKGFLKNLFVSRRTRLEKEGWIFIKPGSPFPVSSEQDVMLLVDLRGYLVLLVACWVLGDDPCEVTVQGQILPGAKAIAYRAFRTKKGT